MRNTAPGIETAPGREVFYVECKSAEDFDFVLDNALAANPDIPMPKDGGAIEEKARLKLKDGRSLLALSYRGDVTGWRNKLVAYCVASSRLWGIARSNRLPLSNDTEIALQSAEIEFED